MKIFGREPAVIIGVAVTIILNIVLTLQGEGFINDAAAGTITDVVNGLGTLLISLAPLLGALLTRQNVYSPATVQEVATQAAATGSATITITPP